MENRWKQHFDKFRKGTAAYLMQQEYDCCGIPETTIAFTCHPTHLDLMEAAYIHSHMQDFRILNASIPNPVSNKDLHLIIDNELFLDHSVPDLIRFIREAERLLMVSRNETEDKARQINAFRNRGITLPEETKQTISDLQDIIIVQRDLLNRPWWKRLFNYQ